MLPLNILVAYPYLQSRMLAMLTDAAAAGARILIDSGAFTAHHAGSAIDLSAYMATLKALPFPTAGYFVLDVVGNPAATDVNLARMRDAGLDPVPIFIRGELPEKLDALYEHAPVVGIAGLAASRNAPGYLKWAMRHVGTRPVHWLGFSRASYIAHYRPFALDCSSWESGGRYGALSLYVGRGRFLRTNRGEFAKPPSPALRVVMEMYGVEVWDMRKEANWRGSDSLGRMLNARSYVRYFADIEHRMGTRCYLAVAEVSRIRRLVEIAQDDAAVKACVGARCIPDPGHA
jgi:hypothetical protein